MNIRETVSSHILTNERKFYGFQSLPPEIRMVIWELSPPQARVFRPFLLDPKDNALLDINAELPAIWAVCRESRWVYDDIGNFIHGICGSTRNGWFSSAIDEVFIHIDILDCMQRMKLGSVEILACPQCLFATPVKCEWFLTAMQRWVSKCRILRLYLCSSNMKFGRRFPSNSNSDLARVRRRGLGRTMPNSPRARNKRRQLV